MRIKCFLWILENLKVISLHISSENVAWDNEGTDGTCSRADIEVGQHSEQDWDQAKSESS